MGYSTHTTREAEQAIRAVMNESEALRRQVGIYDTVKRWPKAEPAARMIQSGRFGYVKEVLAHSVESGNA